VCYSAQVWSDFQKYERLGGKLDIKAYVELFWERKRSGDWIKVIPKGMRDGFMHPRNASEEEAKVASLAAKVRVSW
jgi:hypothetical protein